MCVEAKAKQTSGNHLKKLYITTAAMKVLPSPVGRQTRVFCSSACSTMAAWYALSAMPAGYTHVRAANLHRSSNRLRHFQAHQPLRREVKCRKGACTNAMHHSLHLPYRQEQCWRA